jgi:hypothetical protein
MIHKMILKLDAMMSPLGNVHITPAPMVAGQVIRRKKFNGTVGAVPHATATVVFPATSLASSANEVCGVVGVIPFACGRPSPSVAATAVTCAKPNSRIAGLTCAEVLMISHAQDAAEVLAVLCEIE